MLIALITTRLRTMRAIQVNAPGGPGVLRVATIPPSHLAPEEIRIRWRNVLLCTYCPLQW